MLLENEFHAYVSSFLWQYGVLCTSKFIIRSGEFESGKIAPDKKKREKIWMIKIIPGCGGNILFNSCQEKSCEKYVIPLSVQYVLSIHKAFELSAVNFYVLVFQSPSEIARLPRTCAEDGR